MTAHVTRPVDAPHAEQSPPGFIPTWCGQWEASDSSLREAVLPITSKPDNRRARLQVRFHGEPFGFLELDIAG